jgi:hypothetical protein
VRRWPCRMLRGGTLALSLSRSTLANLGSLYRFTDQTYSSSTCRYCHCCDRESQFRRHRPGIIQLLMEQPVSAVRCGSGLLVVMRSEE